MYPSLPVIIILNQLPCQSFYFQTKTKIRFIKNVYFENKVLKYNANK